MSLCTQEQGDISRRLVMRKRCNVKLVLAVMSLVLTCLFVFKSDVAYASNEKKCSIDAIALFN